MRDELTVVATPEPEGNLPAEIPPTGLLIGLHLPDAFTDAVALGLGEGGQLGWSLISATDGRSRRIADVPDRGLVRLSWAGSGPSCPLFVSSPRPSPFIRRAAPSLPTGLGAILSVPYGDDSEGGLPALLWKI